MLRKKLTDSDLIKILDEIHLTYLIQREGGFDARNDWNVRLNYKISSIYNI